MSTFGHNSDDLQYEGKNKQDNIFTTKMSNLQYKSDKNLDFL